jgi:prepilin-type N-terminal cleavage/methylation domain-containing protein
MKRSQEGGFSLVELLVATVIVVVCSLGVALMILYGTRLGASAREVTLSSSLVKARLEQLRVLPRAAPQRQNGGSLSADVADHFARQGRFGERWTVANGPAGTQLITVAVTAGGPGSPAAQIQMLVR